MTAVRRIPQDKGLVVQPFAVDESMEVVRMLLTVAVRDPGEFDVLRRAGRNDRRAVMPVVEAFGHDQPPSPVNVHAFGAARSPEGERKLDAVRTSDGVE